MVCHSQLKMLKDTAMNQLGTSGTGNHFAEWGSFHLTEPMFGLEPGVYLALLSHSGSRGVGAKIADRYSKLAREAPRSRPKRKVSGMALVGFRRRSGILAFDGTRGQIRFGKSLHHSPESCRRSWPQGSRRGRESPQLRVEGKTGGW